MTKAPQPAHTAARRLVDTLVMNGIDTVFCVPGESYLAVLDALADVEDKIRVITCRHEAGAANMAEAYGKLTGRPGVCMVTRGPEIESPQRTVEIVERAFATALQGRMGPVVIALPEDILHEDGGPAPTRPVIPARSALPTAFLDQLRERLVKAERPLLVLGGSGWTIEAAGAIGDWAERLGLPVSLSFRRKDILSNDRANYAGDLGLGCNPKLMARAREADLLIAVGARLGENPTQGYTLFDRARTAQTLVHIHPGPEELDRVWPTLMSAAADVSLAAEAIAGIDPGRTWTDLGRQARADYEAFSAASIATARAAPSWPRPRGPWAMATPPPWRPRPSIRIARSSASPATATI